MKKLDLFGKLLLVLIISLNVLLSDIGYANEPISSEREELVILTWSDYIDPELIQEFEETFHVSVKEVYYETEEAVDELLLEGDGKGYDLLVLSGLSLTYYIKQNWIAPLTPADIPNIQYIDSQWLYARPKLEGYAVPYFWGTLGIAYRQDFVPEKVTRWKQLYQPAEALRGKIIMIKDSYDTIGPALKSLGYSLNSENYQHYDEVEKLLFAQKPYVKAYGYIALTEESALVTGEAWMAPVYNGDALVLQEYHPEIAFSVPQEGTNLWIDYLVVMQASTKKKLAMDFINFLHEPQHAARLALFTMFATPNKAAEQFLPGDYLQNPMIYPDQATLEKSEYYQELPPRIIRKRNSIFSKLLQ